MTPPCLGNLLAQTGAEVFRFAAWDGGGNSADWLLPAPGFLEELTDVPTAPTLRSLDTYAVALNLAAPPAEVKSAAQFLLEIDPTLAGGGESHPRALRGNFPRPARHGLWQSIPSQLRSSIRAQHLEEQLRKGAVWMGDPPRPGKFRCELKEWPTENRVSAATNWAAAWVPPVFPPLATKLYQESNLREPPAGRQA